MSVATVDLSEVQALPVDRRRAVSMAAVIVLGALLVGPAISRPLGVSYPVFAIVMALSISAIAITALLLWAQSRVTRSVPLTVLALGYELTAIVMIPYLLFYRGLWPQLIEWVSADSQTSGWMWVEWHGLFICSAISYYIARSSSSAAHEREARSFGRLQRRFLWGGAALILLTVPPLIWIDGLPQLTINGTLTPLFTGFSFAIGVGAALAIVLAYRTSHFRSVLDLWVAVACLSMLAEVAARSMSR